MVVYFDFFKFFCFCFIAMMMVKRKVACKKAMEVQKRMEVKTLSAIRSKKGLRV